jgi:autotransporter-associated beta strand protein
MHDAKKTGYFVALPRATLACAVTMLLAACGGGGGGSNVRADPPPAAPPPTTPPPPVVEAPNPAYSDHLLLTNTEAAHDAGFTGKGIRIGIVDSGVNRDQPSLLGRVVSNLTYIDGSENDLSVDDVVEHGTAVAQIAAGKPFGQWPGGIAPGAEIVSARIISDAPPEDDGSGQGNEVHGSLGLKPVHQDLIDRGVRIMNNSWGGLYWTDPAATASIADDYRDFIIPNDGLVVFATGNESQANPSDMAALPSQPGPGGSKPAADLEQGWLAVAALDSDNPAQLADYSNACGSAMRYCLAAPGTVVATGTNDAPDAPSYWEWSGTSLAAPQVSGAAALVWEAFPYFNNDLVRQTLLGTAKDLGDPGVDPVFGYGALDVGKAVKGPARFDWGDVTVDFDGGTSTWSNDIEGDGGLVKRGTGKLVLSASTQYTGNTRVAEGTLSVAGQLNGNARIDSGATFGMGDGVNGNLANGGTLAVEGGASTRTITGDFTQSADATLAFLVGAPLHVEGSASIDGELQVAGIADGYVHSETEDVVVADGGLSGTFDTLTEGPGVFLDATLGYDANHAWLDITRLDVSATAQTFAGMSLASLSSAQRIETAFQQIDRQGQGGTGTISNGFIRIAGEFQHINTEAVAKKALSSLSGQSHAAAAAMTFDSADMGRRALSSRFSAFAGRPDRAGTWQQALGQSGQGGFVADDFAVSGWLMGHDQRIGDHGVAGFAFGETRANNDVANGNPDRSRDRQTQGQFYAGSLRGNAYVLGQLGFGHFDRDIDRRLFTGERDAGVSSRYAGGYTTTSLEAGYRVALGGGALTPYVGAEHTRLRSDGFQEQGADGFGLQSGAWTSSRTQAIAGMRASRGWRNLELYGYAEWQQTLSANGLDIDARFVGVDASAPLSGLQPARSGGLYGIGFDAWLSRDAKLGFGYDQQFGPRGDVRMVSLRYMLGF